MGFDDPAYQKLREEILGKVNGTHPPTNGVPAVQRPQPVSIQRWKSEAMYVVKQALSDVPEEGRPTIASMSHERLVDLLVGQAREVISEKKAPWWPLPDGLSETEIDEELHMLAEKASEEFHRLYVPAVSKVQLPAVGEIDRTPIDAFDAYTQMLADKRGYSWEGNIKEGCTMVLSALMGSGKTTLSMNVTRGWALGEPVLGRICKPSKTLVVVSSKEWDAWADTIGFWEIRGKIFLIPSYKVQFGDGREQAQWFEQTMKELGCNTFVLDTMFDFFGIPPHNTGDQNRMVMAEQTPLLEVVRTNNWSGIVTGHPPKSEAQAPVNRDPEESFGGHTAWSAQHRMRAVIYRKAQGKSTFKTARGGYGDNGMLEEKMLLFDEVTRLVSLGGKWSEYLGTVALPSILQALENDHGWMGRSALVNATKKGEGWVKAGVKEGLRDGSLKSNGRDGRARKYALPDEPDEAPPVLRIVPKQKSFDD